MTRSLLIILVTIISITLTLAVSKPIVKIKNGTIEGVFMQSRKGRLFAAFQGIPYALSPVGELRFEPPKPAKAWKEVFSATKEPNICIQRNIYVHQEEVVGEEDCLYLNVYTPQLLSTTSKNDKKYPVMIWFHGGGWVAGAGNYEFYSPKFLLDHQLILVTVNFRLGPLGFLSTEDLVIPGNNGMKDQAQSIRWVHENIAEFGGDPDRVTLFGESAGGVSTHLHMMSPLSKGLFHRGISQSGTALCSWGLTRPGYAKRKAHKLGELLDCPTSSSRELLKCLKTKNHIDIVSTDRAYQVYDYSPMIPFAPVIEPDHPGAFLKEDPVVALKAGRFFDLPWITGINSHEGAIKVATIYGQQNGKLLRKLNKDFIGVTLVSLLQAEVCSQSLLDNMMRSIREFYLGNRTVDETTRFDVIDMYSDAWFNIAAVNAVRQHLEVSSGQVYFYHFAYRGNASFSKIFGDAERNYGVSHADELQYLFPVGEQLFPDVPLNDEDQKIIDIMTSLWFNFANSGNPTVEITKEVPVKWKPVRSTALEYLHIEDSKNISMKKNLIHDRVKFWNDLPCREDHLELKINKVRDEF